MRWSERQRAMLAEMGVRLWGREVEVVAVDVAGIDVADVAAAARVVETLPAPAAPPKPVATAVDLPAADWLVVGEPFDSIDPRSVQAQLLDNMLRAIGVSRSAVGRDGRATFLAVDDQDAGRQARVRAAIEAVRPRCIVALGRGAAQALFASDEPLGALRGRAHVGYGVPVIVTCSLAFLLRHGEEKGRAWADLCLAVRVVDEAVA